MRTLLVASLALAICGCFQPPGGKAAKNAPAEARLSNAPALATIDKKVGGDSVKIEILQEGSGPETAPGSQVTVHYTGTLTDGKVFDSSHKRGEPFGPITLGAGQVIPGWDQGLVGMRKGEKRRLTIPPSLGYGEQGTGPIPPNATLVFEVDLIDFR